MYLTRTGNCCLLSRMTKKGTASKAPEGIKRNQSVPAQTYLVRNWVQTGNKKRNHNTGLDLRFISLRRWKKTLILRVSHTGTLSSKSFDNYVQPEPVSCDFGQTQQVWI